MKVLNIEDTVTKHTDIKRTLREIGVKDVDWAMDLNSAIEMIVTEDSYDLIISDMYYPAVPGGEETKSGEVLVEKMKELNINIPVVICSSASIKLEGVKGMVKYSPNECWERELQKLIR